MTSPDLESLDDTKLLVDRIFVSTLRLNGLDTLESIMTATRGTMVRAVPGRSTCRLELNGSNSTSIAVYLKRFEPSYLKPLQILLRWCRWPGADDEALREWRKLFRLQEAGFHTAQAIAVGQRKRLGVVVESFLLTREIEKGVPADHYFAHALRDASMERKRKWLTQIGEFAKRFQKARFIHKDFYFSHIYVVEEGNGWRFHLIDLQRVRGPSWHLPRWYTKDLVALTFSARAKAGCSRVHLLQIYKAYARKQKLTPEDKGLIRKLWNRSQRLVRRPPKYRRIWNQPASKSASSSGG